MVLGQGADVVEQTRQMELGRLAAACGSGIAADAAPRLVQRLADGIPAPAKEALGLSLAQVELCHRLRDIVTALGTREGVGGLLDEITHLGIHVHGPAS